MELTQTQTAQTGHEQTTDSAQLEGAVRMHPAVDLLENDQGFQMWVEMPGVDHSSVTVSLERNELTITGHADFSGPDQSRCVTGVAGRRVYERTFRLSDDIDRDQIDAKVKQGVLSLRLPKSNRAQKMMLQVKGG